MQTLTMDDLARVSGGKESLGDVLRASGSIQSLPVSQVHDATVNFIRDHSFFHQGVMDAPIGFGKHFRNVPFIGPTTMVKGVFNGDATQIARGREITRGTWHAQ
jgi:hypothetical protein